MTAFEKPIRYLISTFLLGEAGGKERGKHVAECLQAMCRGEAGAGEDMANKEPSQLCVKVALSFLSRNDHAIIQNG